MTEWFSRIKRRTVRASYLAVVLPLLFPAMASSWSLDELRAQAEKGHADAQYYLAARYAQGEGVKQDFAEAAKWVHMAADQGHVKAQHNLANMYYDGDGVSQDFVRAAKWYRMAANQGHAESQFNLAVMLADGKGVPQDPVAATDWFYKAGLSFIAEGNRDDALQSLELLSEVSPGSPLAKELNDAIRSEDKSSSPSE